MHLLQKFPPGVPNSNFLRYSHPGPKLDDITFTSLHRSIKTKNKKASTARRAAEVDKTKPNLTTALLIAAHSHADLLLGP